MPSIIGPLIGASDTEVRICFEGRANSSYRIEVQSDSATAQAQNCPSGEDGFVEAVFSNLNSNSRYNYRIEDSTGLPVVHPDKCRFTTLPRPGEDADLRFAFYSCHLPYRGTIRERLSTESLAMWTKLEEKIKPGAGGDGASDVRFVMGLGDQLYCDELWGWHARKPARRYRKMEIPELTNAYDNVYRKYFGHDEVQGVLAGCPTYFIWDDHEIRDGWGSQGDEDNVDKPEKSERLDKMFKAATASYEKYQLRHNPFVDPDKGYYAFVYGRIGFVVLDLRRYRRVVNNTLLGEEQRQWLKDWMAANISQCDVVFVACSVPFIHLTNQITRWVNQKGLSFFLRWFGVNDDCIDQWNSDCCIEDATWFADTVFDLSNETGTRFVLLGGDVHTATAAVLRSYREEHAYHPLIYQFTSSPITNVTTWWARCLKWATGEIQLRPGLPYSGRFLRIIPKRNFGIVTVKKHPQLRQYQVSFDLHCEDGSIETFPTGW